MFVDMASLVAEQSEVLQQIEGNVDKTLAYTKEAVVELKQANKLAKKSRKVRLDCSGFLLLIPNLLSTDTLHYAHRCNCYFNRGWRGDWRRCRLWNLKTPVNLFYLCLDPISKQLSRRAAPLQCVFE